MFSLLLKYFTQNIKAKTGDPAVKMDHTSMLAALFADTQRKDPFDEVRTE